MRRILFYISFFSFALLACQRQESANRIQASLDGKWRMIIVKDNISGAAVTKPAGIQGEVDITFEIANSTSGFFKGNTPTNEIAPNNFYLGTNQSLQIPSLLMTKVMETTWGAEFVDNIRNAQEYSFDDNGILYIKTMAKTLLFQRL